MPVRYKKHASPIIFHSVLAGNVTCALLIPLESHMVWIASMSDEMARFRWSGVPRAISRGPVTDMQCVAVCCSVLQCVAVCCSVLQCVAVYSRVLQCVAVCYSRLHCAKVCCSVLQGVAVGCSVSKCDAVCCSAPRFNRSRTTGVERERRRVEGRKRQWEGVCACAWEGNVYVCKYTYICIYRERNICVCIYMYMYIQKCTCALYIYEYPGWLYMNIYV